MSISPAPLEVLDSPERAAALLSPMRLSVLERAGEPRSSTEIAAELGLPRQRVNYHVRELARHGYLAKAGRRKKRNLYEQRWQRTAERYLVAPTVLGGLRPDARRVSDPLSAEYLLALAARMQDEVSRARAEAGAAGQRLATLSVDAELRFESSEQRAAFGRALEGAVARVVAEHASPARTEGGQPGAGRPFRLVVGCHPIPPESDSPDPESPTEEAT